MIRDDRSFVVLVFAIALGLRLLWVLAVPVAPVSDMAFYYEQGRSIASGEGYVSNGAVNGYVYPDYPAGAPTADRPVGYSGFLALLFLVTGPSVLVGTVANAVLGALGVVVFYGIALRLSSDLLVPRLAAILLAVFPNQIAYCGLLSDSVLFQFLLLVGCYLLLSSSVTRALLSGIVFGLATLTRAYAFPLALVWGGVLWRQRGWRNAVANLGIVTLMAGLVVVPWAIRNHRVFGDWAFVSTNLGHNLLAGHNDRCHGQWTPKLPPAAYAPGFENEIERDHALRRLALEYMVRHPVRTIAVSVPKVFYLYADDADGLRWTFKGWLASRQGVRDGVPPAVAYGPGHYGAMAVFEGYYLLVFAGFLVGLISRIRGRLEGLDPQGLGLWTIGYFTTIAIVFFGMSRFHFPVVPFFCLYAAAVLVQRFRSRLELL
ncbi:MAG: glycosyltransferase family 39 protein [Candidatus Eisenbacteria bacterium]|uniref:Glycosyltransferase family 39 protein n=1 Tax=Eiseniibacteriota bacterium TaxID=2212470 RepID=A0A956RRD7_UNCEI|nr:glycosyltransferase family 39 protein [Candidatus Eisenbacteria bacterium]